MSTMRRICSWCRRELGVVAGRDTLGGGYTHCVCRNCLTHILRQSHPPDLVPSSEGS